MKRGFIKSVAILIALVTLFACANIVPPSGGDRDVDAPILESSTPPNSSINFKSERIILQFDEFVALRDINNKLLISPPMLKKPTIKSNGKKVSIVFNESLSENTTYTLNFNDAIVDYTEGNALNNFVYVFSTGSKLDSAMITGKISNAKDGLPAEKAFVLLYTNPDSVTKTPPLYFTRTDENGNFTITNIKVGNYFVYGLADQNANYYYDLPNELIGFRKDALEIKDSINPLVFIDIFKSSNDKQKVLDAIKRENGILKVAFAKPEDNVDVQVLGDEKNIEFSQRLNASKDTLTIYNSIGYEQDIALVVRVNKKAIDTITWEATKQRPKGLEANVSLNVARTGLTYVVDQKQVLQLSLNFPIGKIDETKIYFLEDTSLKKLFPSITKVEDDLSAQLSFKFENAKKYKLTVQEGALIDKAGRKNKSATFVIQIPKADSYSKLAVNFIDFNKKSYYLLELVNAQKKVVSTKIITSASQSVSFPELRSGNYKIRAIEDANKNGRWDTGNFKNALQPERIISHSKTVVLKPGWENEVEFSLK